MRTLRERSWVTVLVLVAVAAACGTGGEEGSGDPTAGGDAATDEGATAAAATDDGVTAAAADDEATAGGGSEPAGAEGGGSRLRVALGTFGAESFEPIAMSTASAFDILTPMYDSLLGISPDGEIAPGVAESWEVDDTGVTFAIREGMTFHNGEELTADDVRFSMLRWLDPELGAEALPPFTLLMEDPEQDIQVVDDFTLRVDTPAGIPERLLGAVSIQQQHEAYVLPQETIEADGIDAFLASPVGTGPWAFVEHIPGDRIVYEAVPDHPFRATPAFDELELVLVPEEATALAQLESGEVDLSPLSPDSVAQIEGSDCCQVVSVEAAIQVHMFFNGSWTEEAGPIADPRVREALSLAIDRQEIIDTVLAGYGTATPSNLPGEFFPGMAGLQPEDFDGELFDPDRAAELLAEAGYADGFEIGVYAFDMSGAPFLASLAEIMLGYWQRLGVTGEIMPTDLGTYFELVENENLDERTIGTVNPYRRRRGFAASQAVNGYTNTETPNGSLVGPPGQEILPDLPARIAEVTSTGGEEGDAIAEAFLREVGELHLAPSLFYADAIFAVGNGAASVDLVEQSPNLGMVYETAQPA